MSEPNTPIRIRSPRPHIPSTLASPTAPPVLPSLTLPASGYAKHFPLQPPDKEYEPPSQPSQGIPSTSQTILQPWARSAKGPMIFQSSSSGEEERPTTINIVDIPPTGSAVPNPPISAPAPTPMWPPFPYPPYPYPNFPPYNPQMAGPSTSPVRTTNRGPRLQDFL